MSKKLPLPLGRIVITFAAEELLEEAHVNVFTLLDRHHAGDWGDMSQDDLDANDSACVDVDDENCERILSSYNVGTGKVWIITEWDRSVTTILLPSDY